MKTTQAATGSEPWIFELSKHSICMGRRSRCSSSCISFIRRTFRCSGFNFSACFIRSALYCFTFRIERSNSFFLSPRWGIVKTTSFSSISTSNGTIISRERLLYRSLISMIPSSRSSSLVSLRRFLYSNVNAWLIAPFVICR